MKRLFFVIAGVLSVVLFTEKNDRLLLNEIVSCNRTIIYDNTGLFPDYIELYNTSKAEKDISGWHLSDTKKKLDKFTFPSGSVVKGRGYLTVWSGKKPDLTWQGTPYKAFKATSDIYTGFSLKNGEKVYLSDPSGRIVDKVTIPLDLKCDMSYARLPHVLKWSKRQASFGRENPFYKRKEKKEVVDVKVEFDKGSGFYSVPFELMLKAPSGFEIYYTLDGTRPTKKSLRYVKPVEIKDASDIPNRYANIREISVKEVYTPDFPVDKGTVVRAKAIRKSDGAESRVFDAVYFVGYDEKSQYNKLPVVSLITDPENLFDYEKGIYVTGKIWDMNDRYVVRSKPNLTRCVNYEMKGKRWHRSGHVDMFDGDGKKVFSEDVDFKIHGKSSRYNERKSFDLILKDYDISLYNGGTDLYSKSKEWLYGRLLRDRNLFFSPMDFVAVFIDGEFWGVYGRKKKVNEKFLSELFDVPLKSLSFSKNIKSESYQSFEKKVSEKKMTVDEVEKEIDVQNYFDYIAFQLYINNMDIALRGGNQIYVRIHDKWRYIPYDVDFSAVQDRNNTFLMTKPKLSLSFEYLFRFLMSDERMKERFIVTFEDMANYHFAPSRVNGELDEFFERYADAMVLSHRRFFKKDYSRQDYAQEISRIRLFFKYRFNNIMPFMKDYFRLTGDLVAVHKPAGEVDGGKVLLNTLRLSSNEEYRGRYYADYDISLDIETFEGYRFLYWLINGEKRTEARTAVKLTGPVTIQAVWEKQSNEK